MIITLTGFMGSGKSRVGRELAKSLGWEFIDLDRYIEHKTGLSIAEIFKEGELKFRAIEAEAVRDIVTMRQITGDDLVLSLGGGTLTITSIRWLILGQTECVFLRTSLDSIIGRLGTKSKSRPLYQNKFDIEELLDERTPVYELAKCTVQTDGLSPKEVSDKIKSFIFRENSITL